MAVSVLLCAAVLAGQSAKIDFQKDAVGQAAKGVSFLLTGQGKPAAWVVKNDDEAHGNVQGSAVDFAKGLRYALDVEVGGARLWAGQ